MSRRPRATARERGYSVAWEKARAGFLAKHPWCECPEHKGTPNPPPSDTVDHIKPHKGDKTLFWDRSNWRAMAHACHSRATASFDGGFGNARREGKSTPLGLVPSSRSGVKAVKVAAAKSPEALKRDRFFGGGKPA